MDLQGAGSLLLCYTHAKQTGRQCYAPFETDPPKPFAPKAALSVAVHIRVIAGLIDDYSLCRDGSALPLHFLTPSAMKSAHTCATVPLDSISESSEHWPQYNLKINPNVFTTRTETELRTLSPLCAPSQKHLRLGPPGYSTGPSAQLSINGDQQTDAYKLTSKIASLVNSFDCPRCAQSMIPIDGNNLSL